MSLTNYSKVFIVPGSLITFALFISCMPSGQYQDTVYSPNGCLSFSRIVKVPYSHLNLPLSPNYKPKLGQDQIHISVNLYL